ncbi:MAG: hypothetical protein KJ015_40495 [Myxococcales bacterium]|nr:hypothetical protein [Sorangiineae bacterium PRO1]MCL4756500.1 hypothetical protein [Myxococcales bacterium]
MLFAWAGGGSARLLTTNGDLVTLLSSTAWPPGTPLEGSFEGSTYRVKVRSCKRSEEEPELPFRIEGRFQNLTREQRERVLRVS